MTTTPGSSTSGTGPTWYDVLGVPRDAGAEEIKAAWRSATDRFEPGSGSSQFRTFNEAADVLLDPERRRAYDASLEARAEKPKGSARFGSRRARTTEPDDHPSTHVDLRKERKRDRVERPAKSAAVRGSAEPAGRRAGLAVLVLAVLTVVALAVAGYFAVQVRRDARVADARDEAPAAAERATKAILSYDYRRLAADRKRASTYLTGGYSKEYDKTFSLLEKQKDGAEGAAVQTKTVVTASVLGSAVVDAEDDVARVLVFVNQVSKRPDRDPQIFQNRVTVTMEKHDNRWLVDDLKSY